MIPRMQRGFTLIEMMVALAVVSLMSIAMLQAYRFSQRALAQTTRVDAAARDIADAQRVLRRLIEQAYPFEVSQATAATAAPRGLTGNASHLEMSAPAPAMDGAVGFYRYTLSLAGTAEAGRFEVSWTLDRNGATEAAPAAATARTEPLLEGVRSISIAYLELVELGNGQIEPNWRDEWIDKRAMPALVRIRVSFAPGDPRHWPELVVAPRISADANCVFDVVSQMCRIAA
jgi:general secretion pathway protein J